MNFRKLTLAYLIYHIQEIANSSLDDTSSIHSFVSEEMSVGDLMESSESLFAYDLEDIRSKKRFIMSLKKRIQYTTLIKFNFEGCIFHENSFETVFLNLKNLSLALRMMSPSYFDLPEHIFYVKSLDDCLLSKIFISNVDNNFLNVISFFIFLKILLERFSFNFIRLYLCEDNLDEQVIDKICKVLECFKRIIFSQATLISTLHIIKESDTKWEKYCSDDDKILLYAFALVKRILCNVDLPIVTDFGFNLDKLVKCGLSNFDVELIVVDQNGTSVKKTVCVPVYIISHIVVMIEFICEDFQFESTHGCIQFEFLTYIYRVKD